MLEKLYERDVRYVALTCHPVTHGGRSEANTAHVEQEQQERLQSQKTHAVVSPGTMMIHLEDTSPALAAVVDTMNLLGAAFEALQLGLQSVAVLLRLQKHVAWL